MVLVELRGHFIGGGVAAGDGVRGGVRDDLVWRQICCGTERHGRHTPVEEHWFVWGVRVCVCVFGEESRFMNVVTMWRGFRRFCLRLWVRFGLEIG